MLLLRTQRANNELSRGQTDSHGQYNVLLYLGVRLHCFCLCCLGAIGKRHHMIGKSHGNPGMLPWPPCCSCNFQIHFLEKLGCIDYNFTEVSPWWSNWPSSQIPDCTCSISLNAPFRTEMYTFLFGMELCGIWNRCIVGFVKLVCCQWFSIGLVIFRCRLGRGNKLLPEPMMTYLSIGFTWLQWMYKTVNGGRAI